MASWKEAAETYTHVVELDPKGKYVKESAYAPCRRGRKRP